MIPPLIIQLATWSQDRSDFMQFIHLMKICIKYIDSDLTCIALGRFFSFYRYKGTSKKKKSHSPGGGLKRMIVFILSAQQMSVACPQYLKHMDHETSFMFPWCVCPALRT